MRWIVVALLLMNVGYFIQGVVTSPGGLGSPSPIDSMDEGELRLLEIVRDSALIPAQERSSSFTQTCVRIGPLPTFEDALSLQEWFNQWGVSSVVVTEGQALPQQFRVYRPPQPDREALTVKVDQFRALVADAGLTVDIYPITRGVLENGIGFGIYEDLISATAISTQLLNLGVSVLVESLTQSSEPIYLQSTLGRSSGNNPSFRWDLPPGYDGIQVSENVC